MAGVELLSIHLPYENLSFEQAPPTQRTFVARHSLHPESCVANKTKPARSRSRVNLPLNLPKNAEIWLPGYLRDRASRLLRREPPRRLWVAITDHYEPLGGKVSMNTALDRVARWEDLWPKIADAAPRDADGKPPCYSFFYPQEEYRSELLAPLARLTEAGIGDVEVHIHHDNETAAGFREKITTFCRQLREEHGLLHDHGGRIVFGFIHGNWALDNSRPDGKWCGLTGEIRLLRELGCYADFTMPSIPSPTQSRILNQVYWSTGPLERPKSFDHGIKALPGAGRQGEMLMIPGPLGLRFRGRLVPRMETGELASYDPPTPYRVKRWLDLAPRIGGDIFLKLYSHGAREDNAATLLGSPNSESGLALLYRSLHQAATERGLEVHWASAFDLFRAVEGLTEGGQATSPESTLSSQAIGAR